MPCRDLYGGFSRGKARSYWQYLAIMEKGHGLRMPACTGKSSPLDSPFWDRNSLPNGFNCRCTVIPLSEL